MIKRFSNIISVLVAWLLILANGSVFGASITIQQDVDEYVGNIVS